MRPLNNRGLKQGRLRRLRESFFFFFCQNRTFRCLNHFEIVPRRLARKVCTRNIIGMNGVVVQEKRFSRCEGIWNPESSKCEALESGILSVEPGILIVLNPESTDFDGIQDHFSGTCEFGSRNPRLGIQDPLSGSGIHWLGSGIRGHLDSFE